MQKQRSQNQKLADIKTQFSCDEGKYKLFYDFENVYSTSENSYQLHHRKSFIKYKEKKMMK